MRQFMRAIEIAEGERADRYVIVACDPEPFSHSKAVELLARIIVFN